MVKFRFHHPIPLCLGLVCLGVGLFLDSANLPGNAESSAESSAEPDPIQASEGAEDTPLGLELWLSGEEPGAEERVSPGVDPYLEPGFEVDPDILESTDPALLDGADSTPSLQTATHQEQDAATAPVAVVIEERGNGCILRIDRQGEVDSSGEVCTQEDFSLALETQWQEWYGNEDGAQGAAIDSTPVSPFQVGVQAIGAVMQVSPFIEDYYFQTARPAPLRSENDRVMLFPLKSWAPITSVFGWRNHPISHTWRLHTGTDLGALWGTPVVAAFSGTVAVADVLDGYGVTVVLEHSHRNQQTLYAHLSEVFVKPGERLEQGEVLGRVGSTGNSTGPHLHFELREWQDAGWVALDAGTVLTAAQMGSDSPLAPPLASPLATTAQPSLAQSLAQASPNILQQWINWFLQMLSALA